MRGEEENDAQGEGASARSGCVGSLLTPLTVGVITGARLSRSQYSLRVLAVLVAICHEEWVRDGRNGAARERRRRLTGVVKGFSVSCKE